MFKDDIKISVIITNNTLGNQLSRTLNSLKEQSFASMEIICIVDNNDKDTVNLLDKYKEDLQITRINHNENISNRNKAINLAKGDYIQFMNYGDYLSKDTLKFAYEQINKDCSDMIIYNLQIIDNENKALFEECTSLNEYADEVVKAENLDTKTLTYISKNIYNKLYKISFLNRNNIRFSEEYHNDENVFNYKVMSTSKMSFLDKNYYQMEQNKDIENPDIIKVCEFLFSYSIENNNYLLNKKYTFNHILDLLRENYYSINKKDQEKYYNLVKLLFEKLEDNYQLNDVLQRYLTSRNKMFYNKIIHSENYYQFNEKINQKKNMKKDYKISLIIPVSNCHKYELESFFRNIKLQSINFKYLELIFIDNNSQVNDGLNYLKELYDTYSNVNVIYLTNKKSHSYQKNIGIKNSRGHCLLFTTLKSIFNKFLLENLYKIMIKEQCDALFTNTKGVDVVNGDNIHFLEYLNDDLVMNCNLYKLDLIKKYQIQFEEEHNSMDVFNQKIVSSGKYIVVLSSNN